MLLLEIIAADFTGDIQWHGAERCEFELNGVKYGVFFEELNMKLPTRDLSLVNVSFGVLHDEFTSIDDLDLTLTLLDKAPTVLNAVATAVLKRLKSDDVRILVFGGADESAEKRANVYRLAASRLRHRLGFKSMKTVKTESNEVLNVLLKDELSDAEVQFVLSGLGLHK